MSPHDPSALDMFNGYGIMGQICYGMVMVMDMVWDSYGMGRKNDLANA